MDADVKKKVCCPALSMECLVKPALIETHDHRPVFPTMQCARQELLAIVFAGHIAAHPETSMSIYA